MTITHNYADSLSLLGQVITPTPLKEMKLAFFNASLAQEIGLDKYIDSSETLLPWLLSPVTPLTKKAFAQKYGGHQFGQWNPDLGDGRGLLLCEVANSQGEITDLHLKGAGPTPYSRHADGRAVLRSTLREYIGSEALHHLGIPSSRSLAMFTSGETVYREQPEMGAMMIRTAPSHLRFGHFEYFYHSRQTDRLNALFDFAFTYHYPQCKHADNPHKAMLKAIVLRTARMIALWQTHGFVHGVMNTDNMSIHGITFDYGPYAFIDNYKADAVFNHSDYSGRYAFNQQPGIALWNLNALAHAFSPFVSIEEIKETLSLFETTFISQYQKAMTERMGLPATQQGVGLMQGFIAMIEDEQQDYTLSFRRLALSLSQQTQSQLPIRDFFVNREKFDSWYTAYQGALLTSNTLAFNPSFIPRTHILQQAIEHAEKGDLTLAQQVLKASSTPYNAQWDYDEIALPPKNAHQVSLSCSS